MKNHILGLSREDRIRLHNLYEIYISKGYLEDDNELRVVVENMMEDNQMGYAMFPMAVQYFYV